MKYCEILWNIFLKAVVAIMICLYSVGLSVNIVSPFILHQFSLISTAAYIIGLLALIFLWRDL